MAFNRDEAIRAAEKALKANKIDQAITEYARVVEHQPRDFATANLLGDLYARAGQTDSAVAQYSRIALQFVADGFLPKAAALFKKILKIRPDDEDALLRLGQIAAKQGLLADARSYLSAVAANRRARGDARGAEDVLIEMADVDPADVEARMQAARLLAARGDADAAGARLRDLAIALLERDAPQDAIDVLREAVHLLPDDRLARRQLIGLLSDLDQAAEAEVYLTRDVAAGDPSLQLVLAKAELETGRLDEGREDLRAALTHAPAFADVTAFMKQITPRNADAGYIAADALVDAALAARDVDRAIETMQTFLHRAPAHVAGAMRLVEMCLEEGLDELLLLAQATLADAYIASGQPQAGLQIARDLADAAPGDGEANARLARARQAAGVADEPIAAAVPGPEPVPAPRPEPATPAIADLVEDVPEFDVYVYGQPSAPDEPPAVKAGGESEEELVARLLAEEAAQESARAPRVDPEIDLTATLDALDAEPAVEAPAAPLEDVFQGFRERNRVEEHDRAEAAIEEAGLAAALGQVADAERLYTDAARHAPFRFRAAFELGRLLRAEGRLADAIEWFERATEVPAPDRDAGHALLYELGDALERHGESMRALATFMELNADAGDYRGVGARVERLARAEIGG